MDSTEQDEREMRAAFDEYVYNDASINWLYWVGQLPLLSAAEAARLMSALDPDIFRDLDTRPNKNDQTRQCNKAAMIQRLAERQGILSATSGEWLAWAEDHRIQIHDGFRLAVQSLTLHGTPETQEAESPENATSDSMQFTDREAGVTTTYRMTQAERDAMLAEKKARQVRGYFVMSEVAQLLDDAYPNLDAAALLKNMIAYYHAGNITVRKRETEIRHLPGEKLRPSHDWMFPDDIRAMLKHWGWTREFPFPSEDAAPAQDTATPAPVTAVEPASDGPAKPAATVDRGWVMKKAALIEKHERQWPTIRRDFQDASENGLSKAAKAPGHGNWFEADILMWARQRGKLSQENQQVPSNSIFNLVGKQHTIED